MSEQYKIGDISKLLGIPAQTLRYYEEQGIVHPKKNETTGYRFYDAWDLNNLMDSVYYRSIGFSLEAIRQMLSSDSMQEKLDKYLHEEALLMDKISEYQEMLTVLACHRQRIEHCLGWLGRITRRTCPGLLFFRHRLKNSFRTAKEDADFTDLKEGMKQWTDRIRVITPTFLFERPSLEEKGTTAPQYWWGWSIPLEKALQKGMNPEPPNEHLPSCTCLYTVFKAGDEGTFAQAFCREVWEKIPPDTPLRSDPFGRLILKAHEGENLSRYFEAWIPIE